MRHVVLAAALLLLPFTSSFANATRTIGVFVALADNQHQGIIPVPQAIGNGEDPERNLYWGTDEGLKGFFDRSKRWKLAEKDDAPHGDVLRTRKYRHAEADVLLEARAYRGEAIRKCIEDFETAIRLASYDLVVYIGHDGLMDFQLPQKPPPVASDSKKRVPDCIVLCCISESYFKDRIVAAGGRPVLLTTQLMYPGSFILAATAEKWIVGAGRGAIREAAGAAYAANQKISTKAATGVFAKLEAADESHPVPGEPKRKKAAGARP